MDFTTATVKVAFFYQGEVCNETKHLDHENDTLFSKILQQFVSL